MAACWWVGICFGLFNKIVDMTVYVVLSFILLLAFMLSVLVLVVICVCRCDGCVGVFVPGGFKIGLLW